LSEKTSGGNAVRAKNHGAQPSGPRAASTDYNHPDGERKFKFSRQPTAASDDPEQGIRFHVKQIRPV
jgi:hypothetical protein